LFGAGLLSYKFFRPLTISAIPLLRRFLGTPRALRRHCERRREEARASTPCARESLEVIQSTSRAEPLAPPRVGFLASAMPKPEICSKKSDSAKGGGAKLSAHAQQKKQLGQLHPNPELIKFYRERVADFERERDELIARLDAVGIRRAELHQAEWELKKRTGEVAELQKALSDAHAYLFEERERLLAIQAENDELKLQETEDRQRIQHLLKLMNPAEPEVGFSRDAPPAAPAAPVASYAKPTTGSELKARESVPRPTPKTAGGNAAPAVPAAAANRAKRTVFLPAQNTETLTLKIEALQAQLDDQRKFSNERIEALLEDRRIRDADEALQKEMAEKKAAELQNRLARTEDLLQKATKDFILARTTPYILEEQQALLEFELSKLSGERKDMQKTIDDAKKDATAVAKAEAESYVNQFKDQMQRRSAIATQYEKRIRELEATTKATKKKMKQLQQRRTMDLEGFTADVTTLRRLLSAVDRRLHQTRLVQRLDDDERLDMLLEQLERRAPDPAGLDGGSSPGGGGGGGKKSKPAGYVGPLDAKGVAFDIRHIRSALGSVEDRLTESKIAAANETLDDDDDDEGGGVRIVPAGETSAAADYVRNRENTGPGVIVAGGAAGAPRGGARPGTARPRAFR
jgi:coiled-coil domain-containing protein 77